MSKSDQLAGKVVIVTGGAAGIGGATSRELVERGAKVVSVDIQAEAGAKLQADLGDSVAFLEGDVSLMETAQSAVALAIEKFGRLDGLVNNAHASRQAAFLDLKEEDCDLSFNTGFKATRQFMRAAHDELAKTKGAVVNFGSGAAITGQPTQAAYVAAKEAIRGLSRVIANEWAKEGIRINIVSPIALTEGVAKCREAFPDMYEHVRSGIPLGRFGDPQKDIAPVVAFLLSDDARYITGQTIMADGGTQKIY